MNDVMEKPKQETRKAFTSDDFWSPDTYEQVLPDDVSPKTFAAVCKRALQTTYNLWDCAKSDPQAVLNALIECAQDGLMPDGKEAALVAFRNNSNNTFNLTYIPMLKGVVTRLHKSGEIRDIRLRMVFANDQWEPTYGDNENFHHVPASDDVGDPIGVYCIVRTLNGGVYRDFMKLEEIKVLKDAAIRKVGGPNKAYKTPWGGAHEFEMWKKSVLKRLAKILPISSNDRRMLDRDNVLYDIGADEIAPERPVRKFMRLNAPLMAEAEPKSTSESAKADEPEKNEAKAKKTEPIQKGEEGEKSEPSINHQGHRAALKGEDALKSWFDSLPEHEQASYAERYDTTWLAIARSADAPREDAPEQNDDMFPGDR